MESTSSSDNCNLELASPTANNCRPFLKWAGGKTQLLPELLARLPRRMNNYFEPFIGGGSLFFRWQPQRAHLWDINAELINCYLVIQTQVDALIESLRKHRYEKDYYYQVRAWDRSPEYQHLPAVDRASRFIFLNKSCFNGLYRVNASGHYNVPFGRYSNPTIVDEENLRACARALKLARVECRTFHDVEHYAGKGDFVYFDPPYAPVSATADFTAYSKDGFGEDQQRALAELCRRLDQRRVHFMLSNSSTPLTLDLYGEFRVQQVQANRAINSNGASRGKVPEILVMNYAETG